MKLQDSTVPEDTVLDDTIPEIPDDLITEVFFRLSVKDVLRFRSTSKPLNSLIKEAYFIKTHFRLSILDKNNFSVIILDIHSPRVNMMDLEGEGEFHKLELPKGTTNRMNGSRVALSCHGLLCISVDCFPGSSWNPKGEYAFIWNPSTGKHKELHSETTLTISSRPFGRAKIGFGYDPFTEDYKIVRIVQFFGSQLLQAEVYSLRRNSYRRVDCPSFEGFYFKATGIGGVLVSNVLHWILMSRSGNPRALLVGFDLVSEEFTELAQPAALGYGYGKELEVLDSCLCVSLTVHQSSELWIMREYGVEESWTKLYSIPDISIPQSSPYGYNRPLILNGEKVLLQIDNSCFVWYNVRTNTAHQVEMPVDEFNAVAHVQSLLPPEVDSGDE